MGTVVSDVAPWGSWVALARELALAPHPDLAATAARAAALPPHQWGLPVAQWLQQVACTPQPRAWLESRGWDLDLLVLPAPPLPDQPTDTDRAAPVTNHGPDPSRHAAAAADPVPGTVQKPLPDPIVFDGTLLGLASVPLGLLEAVGPSTETAMAKMGLVTLYDLLTLVPLRYIDRSRLMKIAGAPQGEDVSLIVTILDISTNFEKRFVRFTLGDETGQLRATFFRTMWMAKKFTKGEKVMAFGRLSTWTPKDGGRPVLTMEHPQIDPLGDDPALILPVYPQSEKHGVSGWKIHRAAQEALARLGPIHDPLPAPLLHARGLPGRDEAIRVVHRPPDLPSATTARDRMAYEELLRLQLMLNLARSAAQATPGVTHRPTGYLVEQFLSGLPYPLTGAQQRVFTEVRADLLASAPMNRLVQGDVGAGKTALAVLALLTALEGGHQGALMAPTEILAWQLFTEMAERMLGVCHQDGRPVTVEFLANKTTVRERRRILGGLADGSVDVVVGTHALLLDEVQFAALGLAVIDEQHRFGVEQRAALVGKAVEGRADTLALTATPIPRTAALTLYGDLAVSVLDELPPGRTPIVTRWERAVSLDDPNDPTWQLIRDQARQGHQAYVVTSLVADNEKLDATSAIETMDSLAAGALHGLRIGLVHGQQKRDEREQTMAQFKDAALDVLVATTVIEVGVNVPNATVIVILDANRFGIAQLHQLRGRVGRGTAASQCVLVGDPTSDDGQTRMEALVASTDGFELAEIDLDLRGEGSILGTGGNQSGQSDLRVASLRTDRDLIPVARADAQELLRRDPKLHHSPDLLGEVQHTVTDEVLAWLHKT